MSAPEPSDIIATIERINFGQERKGLEPFVLCHNGRDMWIERGDEVVIDVDDWQGGAFLEDRLVQPNAGAVTPGANESESETKLPS